MVMLWLFIVLVVIAAAAIIAVFIIDHRSGLGPSTGAPKRSGLSWSRRGSEQVVELPRRLANSASLFQLPAVRKRIRAQRWLHALLAVMLVSGLVTAAAIAGRPVRVTERSDALANRDIVLCLDVSTSMVRIDSSVLTTFSEILEDFDGERVGIVAWNSAAQTIVPLTDDYELLREQMDDLSDVLDIDPDNEQIYPLPDAAKLLAERKIRLFSIYGADEDQPYQDLLDKTPEESREELKTVTEEQGKGRFYDVEDSGTGGQIVKELEKTEVSALGGRKQTRRTDVPQRLVITLSLVLLGYLGLTTWRRA